MNIIAIPAWNSLGLLPPVDPAAAPTGKARSPYPVSLKDLVMRFATSPERWHVMDGFLRYRAQLHTSGLVAGFQWLDGSFMEDVETLEQRAPNDIDVVTFVEVPAAFNPGPVALQLIDHDTAKASYKVDAYFVELNLLPPSQLTSWSAYWYSVWAHRRDQVWKGFLQVELASNEDADAMAWLQQNRPTGVGP